MKNELKLLKGKPIEVAEGLFVHPLTIEEITEISEEVYDSYLSVIMIDNKILQNNSLGFSDDQINELANLSNLELILVLSVAHNGYLFGFVNALKCFLKCEIEIKSLDEVILKNDNTEVLLTNELFDKIKKVIVKQNYLKDEENTTFKPATSKAKALLEKLNKAKEKIQNQSKQDKLSLTEIVSIVATHSNDINILTVWDLTVYQLYTCYLRLLLWDDYHNKYQLIPYSEDINSLDLKHWAVDINKIK